MDEIERIKDQIEKAFYGGAWHGPSILEILNGLSSRKAALKPVAGAHSIWEIVLHIYAWQNAVKRRLQGDPAKLTDEEDWIQIKDFTDLAWNKDLLKLRESIDELIKEVMKLDNVKLEEKATGQTYSNYFMLYGLIQHESYHAGQIALLKKN